MTESCTVPLEEPPCDLEALRHYPMSLVVKEEGVVLHRLAGSLEDYGSKGLRAGDLRLGQLLAWVLGPIIRRRCPRMALDAAEGEARSQVALEIALGTLRRIERPIMELNLIAGWVGYKDAFKYFFFKSQSAFLDAMLKTLDREGLAEHAALLRKARALFGPTYGTAFERWERSKDEKGHLLPALDAALGELSAGFRALPDLLDVAAERIARSRRLTAIWQRRRARVRERDRLEFLYDGLWRCLEPRRDPDGLAERIARLPVAYGQFALALLYRKAALGPDPQLWNLGTLLVQRSGDFAPEIAGALRLLELPEKAAALEEGMELFPKPYPREAELRRDILEARLREEIRETKLWAKGLDLHTRLRHLPFAGGGQEALDEAMIRFARKHDILPRVD